MISIWEKRRYEFNHNWLKNKFLNRLDAFIARLMTSKPNKERLLSFLEEDYPMWLEQSKEAEWLIERFESEMSPLTLFQAPPLSQLNNETSLWLKELIHVLWRARYNMEDMVRTANNTLRGINIAFKDIAGRIAELITALERKQLLDEWDLDRKQSLITKFQEFRNECAFFSKTLSHFPHEVLVI